MADNDGVPKSVGIAPEGPGGQDDITSKPNPEGSDMVYEVGNGPDDVVQYQGFVALAVGVAFIRIVNHAGAYEPNLFLKVPGGQWKPVKAIVVVD